MKMDHKPWSIFIVQISVLNSLFIHIYFIRNWPCLPGWAGSRFWSWQNQIALYLLCLKFWSSRSCPCCNRKQALWFNEHMLLVILHDAGGLLNWELNNSDCKRYSLKPKENPRHPLHKNNADPSKNANLVEQVTIVPMGWWKVSSLAWQNQQAWPATRGWVFIARKMDAWFNECPRPDRLRLAGQQAMALGIAPAVGDLR